jgi:phage baseplate assembly protein gpV/phage protein D
MKTSVLTLPQVTVEIAGQTLSSAQCAALVEIRVQQRLSLPTLCELTFCEESGHDGLISHLAVGLTLRVALRDSPPDLFTGEITAIEYGYEPAQGRTMRVRGYDLLHRLRKRHPVRTHVQVNLAELAKELAGNLGFDIDAPPSTLRWPHLIQRGHSDFELLADRARACGLFFTLRGDTLHLMTLEGLGDDIPLRLGESLLEARIEVNSDPCCRSVTTAGWDPLRIETHEGRADSPRVGRSIAAEIPPEWVEGESEHRLVSQAVQDDRQAEALAQAELDLRVAREVTLWGVAEGNAQLQPGTRIEVEGVASTVAGRYVLTSVTHRVDSEHRYISEISTCPPASPMRVHGTIALLGIVTRVNDPKGQGRVRVTLPAVEEVETDWMSVVTMGSGAKKGLVMLPDVGDRVLVLCTQEDPAQGIVLGGLYGPEGPPDSGVEGEAIKRFTWMTPGGQQVQLDDTRKSIRLRNSDGSYLLLTPGKVNLHAAADLDIEAPGRTVRIRAAAVNFEEA